MLRRSGARACPDERGVTAVLVAVLMSVVLLVSAAFAVDLGQQRVVRRDMQAVADVVAMDVAWQLDGRTLKTLMTNGVISDAVNASLARNRDSFGADADVTWKLGKVDAAGAFVAFSQPADDAKLPTAVQVLAHSSTGFTFGGITGRSRGNATRSAVALVDKSACISVGSYAVRARLGDGTLLGPLVKALGTDVGLNVLDTQGLAAADIKLIDLVKTNIGAGGFDQLLSSTVSLGSFYLAMADVLQNEGGQAAQVALLQKLATVAAKDLMVKVSDIIGIDTSNSAGLDAVANVFDLVAATAFVANGENLLAVPALNVNVAGLSTLNGTVKIGQKPIGKCGKPKVTHAESSQVELKLAGNLASINLGLIKVSGPIKITVNVASAEGVLDAVTCDPSKIVSVLASGGLLDLRIELSLSGLLDLGLFKLPLADIPLIASTSRYPDQSETVNLSVGNEEYTSHQTTGEGSLGAPALSVDTSGVTVIGLPVGTLTSAIVDPLLSIVLNPLVKGLDTLLLSPLLSALGISVSGGDYGIFPKADCGIPQLVG